MFRNSPLSRDNVLWALGAIAEKRPDLVRSTPFYCLFPFADHNEPPTTRGLAARLFGMIQAQEARSAVEQLCEDSEKLTFYVDGKPITTTVGDLARKAIIKMDSEKND